MKRIERAPLPMGRVVVQIATGVEAMLGTWVRSLATIGLLVLSGCGEIFGPAGAAMPCHQTGRERAGAAPAAAALEQLTPLLIRGGPDVVPVKGSDGRYHLLWEVPLQNATTLALTVTDVEVFGDGSLLESLDDETIARSIEVVGTRQASAAIGPGQAAFLFLTAAFETSADLPHQLSHRVTVRADRLPVPMTTEGGRVTVDADAIVPVLGPPLEAGTGYVAADGCCRSTRHIRAALPLDNKEWFAQRFAIDWEQIDERGAFVNGDPADPSSYVIYGKWVLAPADGEIVHVTNGLPDQVPGHLPGASLPLRHIDGNSVIIDIGDGLHALNAHLQKDSILVKVGDRVKRGQPIGRVGNSGNSSAPHLHFHLMDGPSPLASNGRPYVLESFSVIGRGVSTAEFDRVENTEKPLATVRIEGSAQRENALPLDLEIVNFLDR